MSRYKTTSERKHDELKLLFGDRPKIAAIPKRTPRVIKITARKGKL